MRIDTGKPSDGLRDDDSDPIEQLLLSAYPNPERTGCPGSAVIQAYGDQKLEDESIWSHITHCSPCFTEFKEVRDARWQREAKQAQRRKRIKLAAITAVAGAAVVLGLLFMRKGAGVPFAPRPSLLATIDLSNTEVLRGGSGESHQLDLPPVSKRATELQILLPRFSGTGNYVIAILKSRNDRTALAKGSGVATGTDSRAEVRVGIDLSRVSPGTYLLATWRDADRAVYYYPLEIVD
ncbi:MAG: hypothetical protein WA324_05015 [Bryobacteraceae bacterium]